MQWDPLAQNYSMLKYGFKPQLETATFDPYERGGSSIYYTAHEISRVLQHGYRKVRDHLNREIRHKRIDRETALELYKHYSKQKIQLNSFFDWLEITESGKQWIMQHLFAGHANLIGGESNITRSTINLPESIKTLVQTAYYQEEEFVAYGKGV